MIDVCAGVLGCENFRFLENEHKNNNEKSK